MKKWTTLPLVLALVLGCTRAELSPQRIETRPEAEADAQTQSQAPMRAVIKVTPELAALIEAGDLTSGIRTKSDDLNAVAEALDISSLRRVFPDGGQYEELFRLEQGAGGDHQGVRVIVTRTRLT